MEEGRSGPYSRGLNEREQKNRSERVLAAMSECKSEWRRKEKIGQRESDKDIQGTLAQALQIPRSFSSIRANNNVRWIEPASPHRICQVMHCHTMALLVASRLGIGVLETRKDCFTICFSLPRD